MRLGIFTLFCHFSVCFISIAIAITSQSGQCRMYSNCGKRSLFGSQLPCALIEDSDIDPTPKIPTNEESQELNSICGEEWTNQTICCNIDQITTLKENFKKLDSLISSCPACVKNFRNLFCHFTCSSEQSEFIDLIKTATSIDEHKPIVTELDVRVNSSVASSLYDSCKNIKFSATNGFAMDLIGGGAKNYSQFLKFLGDEKPLLGGSPFQINFKYPEEDSKVDVLNLTSFDCNDPLYKCSCSDCPSTCPVLKELHEGSCKVGSVPCFTFSALIIYAVALIGFSGIFVIKKTWSKSRRVQLLNDESNINNLIGGSDDEDYNDQLHSSLYLQGLNGTNTNQVYFLNKFLEKLFAKLAFKCALYPSTVLIITLVITSLLSLGIYTSGKLETNPTRLWVSPEAEAYKQKQYFDENFGPFYRTEQIYIVSENDESVLTNDVVKWWFKVEQEIRSLSVDDISLEELCFRPTEDSTCVIESFTQYFDGKLPFSWKSKLKECTDSPVNCLPSFQQPLKKELLFGGYKNDDALTSRAIVVTFLLNNFEEEDVDDLDNAIKWENKLTDYLQNLDTPKGVRISFNTEPSLEYELNKSTNTDIRIVIISYIVMFFYASLSLNGNFNIIKSTRFTLGFSGILIVLLSISSSIGLLSILGVKSTLIIMEVIPFLILAIGVDNIFLITHELKSINYSYPNESIPFRISKTIGRMGPSILLSSTSQFLTFILASIVAMPAVRNFALYSAGAVFFNSILQLTAFISLLSLDQRRIDNGGSDFFPFFLLSLGSSKNNSGIDKSNNDSDTNLYGNSSSQNTSIRLDEINELFENEINENHYFFDKFINFYTPKILKNKKIVISLFALWTSVSLLFLPYIKFGLDQRIAIPEDSFLIPYFNDVYEYLNVGPPIYFVLKDFDITKRDNQQKICGRFTTCEEFSLSNVLEEERKRSNESTIAEPLANWLDDYLTYLNPQLDECCRIRKTSTDDDLQICAPHAPSRQCKACFADKTWDYSMDGFPENEEFMKYFDIWINSPSDPCPLGGKAPYSSSIKYDNESIISSAFRTSHTPLRSQDDFIHAYKESLRIAKDLKKFLDFDDIFAYSPFYIFFIQYETILKSTFGLIAIALSIIFVNASILLGSIKSSLVLITTVLMILVNIGGIMSIWSISLNAVSLVNLLICVGLAVEFCVHITRAFIVSDRDSRLINNDFRSFTAMTNVGGSVFGGIATTKLIGVIVLAFTKSKIFEVYYFRMWLALVLIASLHALVFLPVFLSLVGGKRYVYSEGSAGIADDIVERLNND